MKIEQMHRLLSGIDEAALVLSPSGEISFVNRAFENLTGFATDDALGKLYPDLLLGSDERGMVSAVFERAEPLSVELYWRRKEGPPLRLLCHHLDFELAVGTRAIVVVSHAPISAPQSGVFDTDSKFRQMLEAAPDAMVFVDSDGIIVLVNSQTEALFGYDRTELLGQPLEILIPQRYRGHHTKHRSDYTKAPRVRRMGAALELFGVRKDGVEFPVEVSLSPLRTSTGYVVMSAIRDTSDRKLAENRIKASLHEKEVLLKEVHHRVKNNLQVINSILNLQSDTIEDINVRQAFDDTRLRIRSIALVHERLYQSRDIAKVDFADYMQGLADDVFRTFDAASRSIGLELDIRRESIPLDKTVNCGLIVNELLSNSLKYAFPAGRHGRIKISLLPAGGELLTLRVEDDGVGMPPGLSWETTDTLGLKLVRGLSGELGGQPVIENRGGACFSLTFPG